ncbi:MAG: hypothetical protein JRN52_04365 [Nitrososphaerota archaeon]|nr:hypothetical protein [Nitrososphaerota archaeon]
MNIREAWKLSKTLYLEVAYESVQLSRGADMMKSGSLTQTPEKQITSLIKSAQRSKLIFAVFVAIGTAIPFASLLIAPGPVSVVSAASLSLAIGLAYLVLYSLQILPSFASAEPFSILLTLPFESGDFSLVTMLSFVRTFDYLAVVCIVVPVVGMAVLTGSVLATILMAAAAVMNAVFAVAIGLGFAGLFYRNITRGGRSRGASLARLIFIVSWGIAAMSIGFVFNIVIYLLPLMNDIISGNLAQWSGWILAVLHPFSFGLAIAYLVYPSFASGSVIPLLLMSFASVVVYALIAYAAGKRTLHTITGLTHGQGVSIIRESAKEYSLKLRKPLYAFMLKDLRLAAKSPSTAMIFAFPVFETAIIILSTSGRVFATEDVLMSTGMGSLFTLMLSSFLLNTERAGLGYSMSLPIGPRMVISGKSLISTIAYLPVPALIIALQLIRQAVTISFLVPLVETFAVSAATTAEIAMFVRGRTLSEALIPKVAPGGRGMSSGFSVMVSSDIGLLIKSLIISGIILVIPLIAYGAIALLLTSQFLAIGIMTLIAAGELAVVQAILRRRR